jgi:hypothetical protein
MCKHRFSRPLAATFVCAMGLTLANGATLGQVKTKSSTPKTASMAVAEVTIHFTSTDTHLKHFGVIVSSGTLVKWCRDDADPTYAIDFGTDSPFATSTFDQSSCKTATPVSVAAASASGIDVYKYTLTMNGNSVDPQIIVVGGSGRPGRK